jgi:hypothetical protein
MRTRTSAALLLLLGVEIRAESPATYQRSTELPAVRMSYTDFVQIATRAKSIADNANQSLQPEEHRREKMEAASGERRLRTPAIFADADLRKAPSVAYEVSYTYSRSGAPISEVSLQMHNRVRFLSVEGTAPDQVDALFASIRESISEHQTLFGGALPNFAFFLLVLATGLFSVMYVLHVLERKGKEFISLPLFIGMLLIVGACTLTVSWLLAEPGWFPGTAVYAGDANLLARYGPQISLLGLVATIVMGLAGIFYSNWLAGREDQATPPPAG